MIQVTVRLFSILHHRPDRAIRARLELSLAEGTAVGEVARHLGVPEDLEIILAVNDQAAGAGAALADTDSLLLIPSVVGSRPSSV